MFERKVRRHCRKKKIIEDYKGFICKTTMTGTLGTNEDNHNKKVKEFILDNLKKRERQPLTAGICSEWLSSSKDMKDLNGYNIIGYTHNCRSQHAVLIAGARPSKNSCEVLIEDNYPGLCDEKRMPWVKCEINNEGKETGRFWIDIDRLSPILIELSKIEKKTKS